jgi:hypothetical protein
VYHKHVELLDRALCLFHLVEYDNAVLADSMAVRQRGRQISASFRIRCGSVSSGGPAIMLIGGAITTQVAISLILAITAGFAQLFSP